MNYIIFLICTSFSLNVLFAADQDFILSANKFHPYFPTYIGNGHFSLSSTQLGTLPAESFMINVYDHGPDDIPRIANLPAWNEINFNNGDKWLNDYANDSSEFSNYSQQLDMSDGILETKYDWNNSGKITNIDVINFISRKNKNTAVSRINFTTNYSDTVTISFPIKGREKPIRQALAKLKTVEPNPPGKFPPLWYPGFIQVLKTSASSDKNSGTMQVLSQCEGRNTLVAIAAEVFYDNIPETKIITSHDKNSSNVIIKFIPEKGIKYSFYKIVSVISGKNNPETLIKNAVDFNKNARKTGYDNLLNDQKNEWKNLWETDIKVTGDEKFQQIIHSMMYYLLSSVDEYTNFSIPPMGLATSGYYGHIFWDADTYMFPPLLLMHPEMGKSMVMFRFNTLDAAKENAKLNKYKGAMYPWESDELGKETTPYFAYQNAIGENHIVGDVALAQWQYYLATKDKNWLRKNGYDVISACADFWLSRVHFNKDKDRYEIGRVVSVSEGLTDVSNETYTNAIAKLNLDIAQKAAGELGINKNPDWENVSAKLFVPYNKAGEYYPTYENAEAGQGATELWSSVVPLLTYPLQINMSENTKRNDLIHAVQSLDKNGAGANMGINFLPIIAAEIGDDSIFNKTIGKTLKGYLRPPFNVLAETHDNNNVNFITGAGAFLQQVIFGYTGLRITEQGIVAKYKPMLPKNISSLTLRNFTINNEKFNIIVENAHLRMDKVK